MFTAQITEQVIKLGVYLVTLVVMGIFIKILLKMMKRDRDELNAVNEATRALFSDVSGTIQMLTSVVEELSREIRENRKRNG